MSKSLTQMCADVVAEKDRQISDLQSQLAEKEKEIEQVTSKLPASYQQVTSKLQASYEKDPLLKKGSKVIYDGAIWSITSHKQNKQLGLVEVKLKFEKTLVMTIKQKLFFMMI